MQEKKILIVDDHPIVLEGIALILNQITNEHNIIKALTGNDALKHASETPIDVAVIDFYLPDIDGTVLINRLKEVSPQTRIVIFTEHDELWVIKEIGQTRPDAVVLKSDDMHELLIAVESASIGLTFRSSNFKAIANEKENAFTPREIEILKYVSKGQQSREVARQLCISENTVEYHRKKIMRRLGATNNAHLISIAISTGIIKPE